MANFRKHTAHHHQHHQHQEPSVHDSTFFFVGPYDDTTAFRGPQALKSIKPINTSLFNLQPMSKTSSLAASPISEHGDCFSDDDDDSAILGDDEAYDEDELSRSPRRRHSGAMSISSEDLPYCFDREALLRDSAAHRERHQHLKALKSRNQSGAFAAHEQWDGEIDGPSMALWVPETQRSAEGCKRRRVEKSQSLPLRSSSAEESRPQRHSHEVEGPMMALWGM